ncbi:FmdB family zinc ribbon protein [Chloroflexota bacterium]
MPIYEYYCPTCQDKFELLRSMSSITEDTMCPKCNSKGQKVFSICASFSKGSDGVSASIGGSGKCAGCMQSSCSSC